MSAAPLWLALLAFLLVYGLWIFYLAVMNLKRAKDAGTLRPWARRFGGPVLLLGVLLDVLVNWIVFTVLLIEWPREALVTARLKRHIQTGAGWRHRVARWFCADLLDAFDPSGCHCD